MTTYTQAQMNYQKKKTSFAWAKYYEAKAQSADNTIMVVNMITSSGINRNNGKLERPSTLPSHITAEFMNMAEKLNMEHSCPICFDLVSSQTISITWCGHILCKKCNDTLPEKKCPICRKDL